MRVNNTLLMINLIFILSGMFIVSTISYKIDERCTTINKEK